MRPKRPLAGLFQATGEQCFHYVRVGRSFLCSRWLLLPLGITAMPALACLTQSLPQGSEIRRVLTTTDVGLCAGGRGTESLNNVRDKQSRDGGSDQDHWWVDGMLAS